MYRFSQDHGKLFDLLVEGQIVAGFVKHKIQEPDLFFDDVCQIVRPEPHKIYIHARGTLYGSVYPFDKGIGSELDLFSNECQRLNLRWIEAHV